MLFVCVKIITVKNVGDDKKSKKNTATCGIKKLGYKDSNLEMLESESSALPFGDSPLLSTDDIIL